MTMSSLYPILYKILFYKKHLFIDNRPPPSRDRHSGESQNPL